MKSKDVLKCGIVIFLLGMAIMSFIDPLLRYVIPDIPVAGTSFLKKIYDSWLTNISLIISCSIVLIVCDIKHSALAVNLKRVRSLLHNTYVFLPLVILHVGIFCICTTILNRFQIYIPIYGANILPILGNDIINGALANTLFFSNVILMAPIVEELFFRLFLLRQLERFLSFKYSCILISLFFGFFHPHSLGAFFLSIVLFIIYGKTRSILTAIFVHIGFNATIIFLTVINQIIIIQYGKPLISDFLENLIVGIIALCVSVIWLFHFLRASSPISQYTDPLISKEEPKVWLSPSGCNR